MTTASAAVALPPETVMFVYVTARERIQAEEIGMAIVRSHLAACANILDNMTSYYWWHDQVQHDSEAILILKTTAERIDALIARVKELHGYDIPCIEAYPVTHA